MVINTNLSAQVSSRILAGSSTQLAKSLARLSSGFKNISPDDDAAGQAVSGRIVAQISRIGAAISNVNNAASYGQTQDGFLKNVGKALDRMGELAVLAQDITKTDPDRALYQEEYQTLGEYINNIAQKKFNGVSLFDGVTLDITTDGEGDASSYFAMPGINLGATVYTDAQTASVATTGGAVAAASVVQTAIAALAEARGTVGASQARLIFTSEQLSMLKINLSAANSRMMDVDVGEESARFARWNVLVQAGTAMLVQANTLPQSVLRLLG